MIMNDEKTFLGREKKGYLFFKIGFDHFLTTNKQKSVKNTILVLLKSDMVIPIRAWFWLQYFADVF